MEIHVPVVKDMEKNLDAHHITFVIKEKKIAVIVEGVGIFTEKLVCTVKEVELRFVQRVEGIILQ
jgi:hypothetical protein